MATQAICYVYLFQDSVVFLCCKRRKELNPKIMFKAILSISQETPKRQKAV